MNPLASTLNMSRRRRLRAILLSLSLPFGAWTGLCIEAHATAAPTASDEATSQPVYIAGGTVHIGDGTIKINATVEIKDGKVVAVHDAYDLANIPPNARTIDATGKIVTPGLIGADTSLGLIEIELEASTRDQSRQDDSTIRAGFRPASAINADSSLLRVQAVEGVTTAAVAPSGGLLSGQVAWIDLLQGDHENIVHAPSIAIDGSLGQRVAGSRAEALDTLRRALEDAALLQKKAGAFERRQLRDLVAHPRDLEALFPVLDRTIPLTLSINRASDILAALTLASDFNIRLTILGGAEAWKVRAQLAKAGVVVVAQPSSNLPSSFESLGSRLENAAMLHAAGVKVGIAVLGDPHNTRNARQEAGIAASYGLPREVAVAAITRNIAAAYGMEDSHGTLSPGSVANVVVWSGDPLELSSWPSQVLIRGRAIPLVSRQSLLRDRYLQRLRARK